MSFFSSSKAKHTTDSTSSKYRAGKSTATKSRRSFREHPSHRRPEKLDLSSSNLHTSHSKPPPSLNSTIITLSVGSTPPRLFGAHTDVLTRAPWFASALHSHLYNSESRVLRLADEIPEVFACVLEHLYKGDYTPKLCYDARRAIWTLDPDATAVPAPGGHGSPGSTASSTNSMTVWIPAECTSPAVAHSPTAAQPHPQHPSSGALGVVVLRDTAVYCAADRYGLPQLKKLALRKQGLQSGVPVVTVLASARYAYAHTPESDRHLRAHYLALIIRSRNTFKKSGTMQMEMGALSPRLGGATARDEGMGTGLWFDLFVAMCNHLDDVEGMVKSPH